MASHTRCASHTREVRTQRKPAYARARQRSTPARRVRSPIRMTHKQSRSHTNDRHKLNTKHIRCIVESSACAVRPRAHRTRLWCSPATAVMTDHSPTLPAMSARAVRRAQRQRWIARRRTSPATSRRRPITTHTCHASTDTRTPSHTTAGAASACACAVGRRSPV
jgi:hypothetical protein